MFMERSDPVEYCAVYEPMQIITMTFGSAFLCYIFAIIYAKFAVTRSSIRFSSNAMLQRYDDVDGTTGAALTIRYFNVWGLALNAPEFSLVVEKRHMLPDGSSRLYQHSGEISNLQNSAGLLIPTVKLVHMVDDKSPFYYAHGPSHSDFSTTERFHIVGKVSDEFDYE